MSEVLVESEFSLRSRHREIGDLLAQNQIERAQKRLLDFVRDFGTRADERVAILLGGELRGLMDEQRKYGASKGPEILKVCERMLSLADKVADAFESSEPAATEITPTQTENPDIRVLPSPAQESSSDTATHYVPLDHARAEFDRKRRGEFDDKAAYIATDVSKQYGRKGFKLEPISFTLRPGEITGVVGENGAGKTTLLRIVAGELLATSGTYLYPTLQPDVTKSNKLNWAKVRQQIGYVQQRPNRWSGSLALNLHREAAFHGIFGKENLDEVDFVLQRLGLEKYRDAKWGQLPGGFKMRFELARTLVTRPKLLVLDEPLAPLDVLSQQLYLQDLRDLSRSATNPVPILISSQHIYEIEEVADRLLYIEDGKTFFNGPVEEVGSDRDFNMFEIGTRASFLDVQSVASALDCELSRTSELRYMLTTGRNVSTSQLIDALSTKGIAFHYFRDVSRSTRTMFKGTTSG